MVPEDHVFAVIWGWEWEFGNADYNNALVSPSPTPPQSATTHTVPKVQHSSFALTDRYLWSSHDHSRGPAGVQSMCVRTATNRFPFWSLRMVLGQGAGPGRGLVPLALQGRGLWREGLLPQRTQVHSKGKRAAHTVIVPVDKERLRIVDHDKVNGFGLDVGTLDLRRLEDREGKLAPYLAVCSPSGPPSTPPLNEHPEVPRAKSSHLPFTM